MESDKGAAFWRAGGAVEFSWQMSSERTRGGERVDVYLLTAESAPQSLLAAVLQCHFYDWCFRLPGPDKLQILLLRVSCITCHEGSLLSMYVKDLKLWLRHAALEGVSLSCSEEYALTL